VNASTWSGNCTQCKHVRDGPYCVKIVQYQNTNITANALLVIENCVGGCTGPLNKLGDIGCKSCEKAIVSMYDPNVVEECLKAAEPCPDGFYHDNWTSEEGALKSLTGKSVCRKCHQRCRIAPRMEFMSRL